MKASQVLILFGWLVAGGMMSISSAVATDRQYARIKSDYGWQHSGCPSRYTCASLYGAYGPWGGAAYWGRYTYGGWGYYR